MTKIASDTSPFAGADSPTGVEINVAQAGKAEYSGTTGYIQYQNGEVYWTAPDGETYVVDSLSALWGHIQGTLTDQADLVAALATKAEVVHAHDDLYYTESEVDAKLSAMVEFTTGAKKTGIDSGTFGEISITDDYAYFCVLGGVAGVAKWKKVPLFNT